MNYKTIIEHIGNTPLVKIPFSTNPTILAKLEYLNPGGSLKDRLAKWTIEQAEKKGYLKPGGTIIDASSGNMGIAIAMIGATKQYNVIITVSEKISTEKLKTLKAYGAQVVICPVTKSITDPKSYHAQAVKLAQSIPNSFMPNQYFNPENAIAHYLSLGPEIYEQTNGKVSHVFAAAGTAGHISGVGRYLKEKNTNIKVIAVDSAHSWRATGGNPQPYQVEGMGIDFDSPVLDTEVIDDIALVEDDNALNMLDIMAQQYGLLVGPSSGAVVYTALQYAKTLSTDHVCVMIFGDSGRAYLTKNFYAQPSKKRLAYQHVEKRLE